LSVNPSIGSVVVGGLVEVSLLELSLLDPPVVELSPLDPLVDEEPPLDPLVDEEPPLDPLVDEEPPLVLLVELDVELDEVLSSQSVIGAERGARTRLPGKPGLLGLRQNAAALARSRACMASC
jgi:hypothetical protein